MEVSNTHNLKHFYMISNKLLFLRHVDQSVQTQAKSHSIETLIS